MSPNLNDTKPCWWPQARFWSLTFSLFLRLSDMFQNLKKSILTRLKCSDFSGNTTIRVWNCNLEISSWVLGCFLWTDTSNILPKEYNETAEHLTEMKNVFTPPLFFVNTLWRIASSTSSTVWLASWSEPEVLHQSFICTLTVPLRHNKLLIICLTTITFPFASYFVMPTSTYSLQNASVDEQLADMHLLEGTLDAGKKKKKLLLFLL